MSGVGPIVKRAIDVIFSLMILLILLPVMAVVAVSNPLDDGPSRVFPATPPRVQNETLRPVQVSHNA